ncbi:MAG TPA: hypothetical protein VMT06_03155 [Candidatus Eisenbacteria bacterium]|nr:hypothetical protein [Candidatus Eisenbacteria bacterium]
MGWKAVRKKRAIVILELIDESLGQRNDLIAQELLAWFKEDAVSAPWIRDVKAVQIEEE